MGKVEERLQELGIKLPEPLDPGKYQFNFLPINRYGEWMYVSGSSAMTTGQLGKDMTVEQGYEAARGSALACLSAIQAELGTLDRVKKVFKVLGFVNSADGFTQQPAVMNGCSDLLVQVLGEKGRHARSAIGTNSLPFGLAVEVEMLLVIEP
jgi:enamine deaminase RidA (YjgF/YER057c/UK114 family)